MGFFQRIRNALCRFMYGRNGADQLGLYVIWTAVAVNVVTIFVRNATAHMILSILGTVLTIVALFRIFSRNLPRRRAENAKFLEKVIWPVQRRRNAARQRRQDKAHKYFTCPSCGTVCRVPRGKGKIVITCPKCQGQIRGRT